MRKKLNFSYDEKKDILFLYTEEEYKGSVSIFGMTVDFTNDNMVKGVEIPEATKFFSDFLEKKVSKNVLKKISNFHLDIRRAGKMQSTQVDFKVNSESFIIPLMTMENPNYVPAY